MQALLDATIGAYSLNQYFFVAFIIIPIANEANNLQQRKLLSHRLSIIRQWVLGETSFFAENTNDKNGHLDTRNERREGSASWSLGPCAAQ